MNAQTAEKDYFTDHSILLDPYAYFREMAANGPVCQLQSHDILLVTGFDECLEVLKNNEDFSSINSAASAVFPLPFTPQGSDISAQIEANRDKFPASDLIVTFDDLRHSNTRSVMNRMFTPKRLKANEEFMRDYADQLVMGAVAKGSCDVVNEIATPYVTLVVADLLGVPAEDREKFRACIDKAPPAGSLDQEERPEAEHPLVYMAGFFMNYFQERREHPREDLLNELANASYPDGSQSDLMDMVKLAIFMFAAGQDTSAKLLGNAMRYIVEQPGLQDQIRQDHSLIPALIEEVLRIEGSTKSTFRLARRDTTIGDVAVPAGKRIMVALAAGNRDPRHWQDPDVLQLNRDRARDHIAFGRGVHTCAGAPLARAEVRVILERFFDHTSHIELSEEKHGSPGERKLSYEPSFIIRGLNNLYIDLQAK